MGVNVVDGVLVALMAGSLYYGWKNGVLRLVVAVTGAMVGFIAGRELYEPVAGIFSAAAGFRPPNIFDGLAYLYVWCLAALGWFWAIRKAYPYTRLTTAEVGGLVWSVDRFGGLFLGGVLGLTLAVALVGVADLLVAYRWPAFVPLNIKDTLDLGFRNAALVRWMNSEFSGFVTFMGHWVPGLALAGEGQPQP
jgi:uncharacterized membrane protein required for colicin V production